MMTDSSHRSLPPLVDGSVYGHLTVTVDEILWCRKYPGEVIVLFQWWGDIGSITFRPADISKYPESAKENNSVKYSIQTNFSLFETYLKQCNKLKLLVVNDGTKEIIGHVEINNLHDHITKLQLQKYFPIVTSSGTRIGDLRVDFDLSMNSITEEISKKTRKRSRRKTKSANNSFRSANEEEKSKQFKKGCKTCSDHIKPFKKSGTENPLDFEVPGSPKSVHAPPNTGKSDSSSYVLLDVFEKGKKLRDAMVLSVLEDSDVPVDLNEELLLKLDRDEDIKLPYKSSKIQKNGDIVMPREEKLIINYLEGKAMKEEEEKLVLNTLHPEDVESSDPKPSRLLNQQEDCCLKSKTSCAHSMPSRPNTGDTSSCVDTKTSCINRENISSLMKKINCFRLTVDSLTLTSAGWKKINQAVDTKSKNYGIVPPPGATYFVECHFVEDTPRSQAQLWKASPLRFCSRRQIEDVVYFGQSSAHSLRPPHSLTHAWSELESVNCLVCWRHLHQRVPALLGTFRLATLLPAESLCVEVEDTLPVVADNVSVVAHIRVKLQLGKDKLYFGSALLEDSPRDLQEEKKIPNNYEQDKNVSTVKNTSPLDVKDLQSKDQQFGVDIKSKEHSFNPSANIKQLDRNITEPRTALPNYIDIPVCTNCGQNFVLANVKNSSDCSLCVSCSSLLGQHQSVVEPNFKISIPKNFNSKEKRHHEFLLAIDTVKGFPLFANVQEELSCYVDYKFPQITSGLKAEMCMTEMTSRVVDVETQPCFGSVHRHSLALPVVLPLSPLLASCSPGVTLRLWVRYYKPTPRDHMVAMALLPMDELCLMELEFDEKQQEIAITKVFELPLALVPSSVTAPYQKFQTTGVLRVSVTYSNFVSPPPKLVSKTTEKTAEDHNEPNIHPMMNDRRTQLEPKSKHELKPISALLDRISVPVQKNKPETEERLRADKNRFWTGPFGKENLENNKYVDKSNEPSNQQGDFPSLKTFPQNNIPAVDSLNKIDSARSNSCVESSRPVMKEDLDILAESIEHRFNQLQSDLMKEKQKGLAEINSFVTETRKLNTPSKCEINDDFLSFHSLSSNSSIESLPFILGPPADFKDMKNTVACPKGKVLSDSLSDRSISDTITGFLKEEKNVANYGSNDSNDKSNIKPEAAKPKTFKAKIKIDRAVNLKAVKAPSNGKKGKVPPSSWVSFGISDCCEQNCGTGGIICTGQRFTTPVVRRNHNPIWNLSWDVDLPVEYLQQEDKRLAFRVFEENLNLCLGRATASIAILRSGLPCLSSWLSIDDPSGACKGQLKVVITPLEDVRQYHDCSVFDMEEDEFEELKEKKPETETVENDNSKDSIFVASQTEIFLKKEIDAASKDKGVQEPKNQADEEQAIDREDLFLADDIISDYKNTLENNFRNEMAGLENLIKFLRVGSMSSELSFIRSSENKENQSSNPTPQLFGGETRTAIALESHNNVSHMKNVTINNQNQPYNQNNQKDRCLIDASTETADKDGVHCTSNQQSNDDILSKLLQQISAFQPSVIKITDNTSQTLAPETKESFTEMSNTESEQEAETNRSVCMKDASTETEYNSGNQVSKPNNYNVSSHHVCGELGNVLLQHFLTCKPAAVKVTDSTTQTDTQDGLSTTNSSGVFMSGISIDASKENFPSTSGQQNIKPDWVPIESQTSSERLIAIDNNIRDLERFLKKNLIIPDREDIPLPDSKEGSSVGSLNEIIDFSGKENNQSSSDVESLESYSQMIVFPRETPDGGNPSSVPDIQIPSNSDKSETTLRRQGTFVIEKLTANPEDTKESPCEEKS